MAIQRVRKDYHTWTNSSVGCALFEVIVADTASYGWIEKGCAIETGGIDHKKRQ